MTLHIVVAAYFMFSVGLFMYLFARWQAGLRDVVEKQTPVIKEQAAASHELANETTKLRREARDIYNAPDPFEELVDRIRMRRSRG